MTPFRDFLNFLGINIENRQPPTPGISQVATASLIGGIFDADAGRQKLERDTKMRGGPRVPSNAEQLGAVREGRRGFIPNNWLY